MKRRVKTLGQQGQAAVEAAIILPLMIFMILGMVQLTMMHQAKLMTEYAAYQACRAGIVWNANEDMMTNAAIVALTPTFGRTDNILNFALTWAKMKALTELTQAIDNGMQQGEQAIKDVFGKLGMNVGAVDFNPDISFIEVDRVAPTKADFGEDEEEIDFDDPGNRDKTRLQVRVRYLYWLRIPFVNWVIHEMWMAGVTGVKLTGPIWSPWMKGAPGDWQTRRTVTKAMIAAKSFQAYAPWMNYFLNSSQAQKELGFISLLAQAGIYVMPLTASYSMRMQSNPYKKNTDR